MKKITKKRARACIAELIQVMEKHNLSIAITRDEEFVIENFNSFWVNELEKAIETVNKNN